MKYATKNLRQNIILLIVDIKRIQSKQLTMQKDEL